MTGVARQPWERREAGDRKETPPAFEAFALYRDLGPGRGIAKVAKELGKAKRLIERWSAQHDWVDRAAAWDAHLDRTATDASTDAVRQMNERQAAIAVRLQGKAVEGLQQLDATKMSAADVARLADTGAKLERLARGEVTSRDGTATDDVTALASDPELADAAHAFLLRVAETHAP